MFSQICYLLYLFQKFNVTVCKLSRMKIGLIREGRTPHDKRVAFTPEQCVYIQQHFPGIKITVQPSDWRCYTNEEYLSKKITISEDLSDCDILMGIKQVPIDDLIAGKNYLFFSHTIKKQPNKKQSRN